MSVGGFKFHRLYEMSANPIEDLRKSSIPPSPFYLSFLLIRLDSLLFRHRSTLHTPFLSLPFSTHKSKLALFISFVGPFLSLCVTFICSILLINRLLIYLSISHPPKPPARVNGIREDHSTENTQDAEE